MSISPVWHEIELPASSEWVDFEHETGLRLRRPTFYDGAARKVRFAAPVAGRWDWVDGDASGEFEVGAVVPLTDLDLEVLGHARVAGLLPAFVPDPEFARATFDKYEAHLLLERLGLPSPPTVLPGGAVSHYPVMVKPR